MLITKCKHCVCENENLKNQVADYDVIKKIARESESKNAELMALCSKLEKESSNLYNEYEDLKTKVSKLHEKKKKYKDECNRLERKNQVLENSLSVLTQIQKSEMNKHDQTMLQENDNRYQSYSRLSHFKSNPVSKVERLEEYHITENRGYTIGRRQEVYKGMQFPKWDTRLANGRISDKARINEYN